MKRIFLFGGSFNPPHLHHREMVVKLSELCKKGDEVLVIPCGVRPDKETTNDIDPVHRAALVDLMFKGIPNVRVKLFDLEQKTFTRNHELQSKFEANSEVWHVIGTDLIEGGATGNSFIQKSWHNGVEIWKELNFIIFARNGHKGNEEDFPPNCMLIRLPVEAESFSSTIVRDAVFHRKPYNHYVTPEIVDFIESHGLYRGRVPKNPRPFEIENPRIITFVDTHNKDSLAIQERLRSLEGSDNPNLIVSIGGDGTMLRAIREMWRLRLPFYGLNTGHLGFLLNSQSFDGINIPLNDLKVYESPLLYVETETADGKISKHLAFNDAVVKMPGGQSSWLQISENGETSIEKVVCDGMVISTAAGSTSYAYALGASPMPVGTSNLIIAGIAVSKPFGWRPAVRPIGTVFEIINLDPKYRGVHGYVDGVRCGDGDIVRMRVRTSNIASAQLLFTSDYDLNKKLYRLQYPG